MEAGDYGAGDVEFEVDKECAEDEEADGEVGIGEPAEETLAGGGCDGEDGCVPEVQGDFAAVEAVNLTVVEGAEEGLIVGGVTRSMSFRLRASSSL